MSITIFEKKLLNACYILQMEKDILSKKYSQSYKKSIDRKYCKLIKDLKNKEKNINTRIPFLILICVLLAITFSSNSDVMFQFLSCAFSLLGVFTSFFFLYAIKYQNRIKKIKKRFDDGKKFSM